MFLHPQSSCSAATAGDTPGFNAVFCLKCSFSSHIVVRGGQRSLAVRPSSAILWPCCVVRGMVLNVSFVGAPVVSIRCERSDGHAVSSRGISDKIAILKTRLETAEHLLEATAQALGQTGTEVGWMQCDVACHTICLRTSRELAVVPCHSMPQCFHITVLWLHDGVGRLPGRLWSPRGLVCEGLHQSAQLFTRTSTDCFVHLSADLFHFVTSVVYDGALTGGWGRVRVELDY